jgi:CheY-like chemotaxis protein
MADDRFEILVVEDNRAMSQVLRFNLERAGFAATVAYNGQEAIEQLQEHKFHLMITDYQMPILDGGQLCHYVRGTLGLVDLPIALCSAKGMEADAANLVVECGLCQLFFKPVSPQAIVNFVMKQTGTTLSA